MGKYSSEKIEGIAIDEIRASIRKTDRLSPFVNDNDKEPSWDGFVYIYPNSLKKKEQMIGRVAVQVKGKEIKTDFEKKIKYPISVADLRNYYSDIGVIYFVVLENSKTNENKIYYVELPPIRLKALLLGTETQKRLSLELRPFIESNDFKENLFLNFYKNSHKQISFVSSGNTIPSLSHIMNLNGEKKIRFAKYCFDKKPSISEFIQSNQVYAYAEIENSGFKLDIPLDLSLKGFSFTQKPNVKIHINNQQYYDYFERNITNDNCEIKIGGAITICIPEDASKMNFTFTLPKYLKDIEKDLGFFVAVIKNEGFSFEENFLKIERSIIDKTFDVDALENIYYEVTHFRMVLDNLNCKRDFIYDELSKEDRNLMNLLYLALIEKKSVELNDLGPVTLVHQKFAGIKFMLLVESIDETNRKFIVRDYFNKDVDICFEFKKGEKVKLPQYVLLTTEELIEVGNIKLEEIMQTIYNFRKSEYLVTFSLELCQNLVSAFYKSNNNDYLKVAIELSDWLKKNITKYEESGKRIKQFLKDNKKILDKGAN